VRRRSPTSTSGKGHPQDRGHVHLLYHHRWQEPRKGRSGLHGAVEITRYPRLWEGKGGSTVADLGVMKEGEILKRLDRFRPVEWLKGMKKGDISLPIRTTPIIYLSGSEQRGRKGPRPPGGLQVDKGGGSRPKGRRWWQKPKRKQLSPTSRSTFQGHRISGQNVNCYSFCGPVPAEHSGVFSLSIDRRSMINPWRLLENTISSDSKRRKHPTNRSTNGKNRHTGNTMSPSKGGRPRFPERGPEEEDKGKGGLRSHFKTVYSGKDVFSV